MVCIGEDKLVVNRPVALKLLGTYLASIVPKTALGVYGTVDGPVREMWNQSRGNGERWWRSSRIRLLCTVKESDSVVFNMLWSTSIEPVSCC